MSTWKHFEEIECWQLARKLDHMIWELIHTTALKRDFALRDQMAKASGKCMDNIAEGYERDGNREFIQFTSISKGSVGELRSQLYRCLDRGYIDEPTRSTLDSFASKVGYKLGGLIRHLKTSEFRGPKFKPQ
ncbi:MAG: four helix bundle protein [Saprospiraceae bacterium]|nr:four helix bundle protein [Saprospiraceae bacterium]